MVALSVHDLGIVNFQDAWEVQLQVHSAVSRGERGPVLLLVEHPPVLTLGKNARADFIRATGSELKELGVDVLRIDRGGEVTAHLPQQIVAYPIFNLRALNLGPKAHVAHLESAVISCLREYGISSGIDSINPGVWVGEAKICAIGIRVMNRTSLHGLAINVNNDLNLFSAIVPCGLSGRSVTSMKQELGHEVELSQVKATLIKSIVSAFGLEKVAVAP